MTTGDVDALANPGWPQASAYSSNATFHEVNASFFYEKIKDPGSPAIYAVIDYLYYSPDGADITKRSWSIFDQASYELIDNLTITGGVRYSKDYQAQSVGLTYSYAASAFPMADFRDIDSLTATTPGCYSASTGATGSGSWDKITWKAGVDYQIKPETLLYASATTGYKPGGIQAGTDPPGPCRG
ncbi:MAG: TonB-dependent receptor [Novosphingobium sp.]